MILDHMSHNPDCYMLIMHSANYIVGCAGCPVLSYMFHIMQGCPVLSCMFHIVQNLNETFKCSGGSSSNLKLLKHIIKDVRKSVLSNTLITAL